MRGWFEEPYRHALSARGIITTRFDSINRFTGEREGFLYIYDDDEPLGFIDILVGRDRIKRIYGDGIPDDTAIVTAIRIYDQYQKLGHGKRLLTAVEDHASKFGMKRIWLMSVVNEGFFKLNGYERIYPDPDLTAKVGIIYEKVL